MIMHKHCNTLVEFSTAALRIKTRRHTNFRFVTVLDVTVDRENINDHASVNQRHLGLQLAITVNLFTRRRFQKGCLIIPMDVIDFRLAHSKIVMH